MIRKAARDHTREPLPASVGDSHKQNNGDN